MSEDEKGERMANRTLLLCPAATAPLALMSQAQILLGVIAPVCGFAFPRGLYLWGITPAYHPPFTQGLSVYLVKREGVGLIGGTHGLVAFAAITAAPISFATFCCTVLSAAVAGLRLLMGGPVSR